MYLLPAFTSQPALDQIYNCDALSLLRALNTGTIDMVLTSPPYNLKNSTGNGLKGKSTKSLWKNAGLRSGYANYSDDMPRSDYVSWQRACLSEMCRVVKNTGVIFYNHKTRVQDGVMESPDEIVRGFPVRQIIIWDRGSGFNFNSGYFVPMYELIYVIAKPEFKLNEGANGLGDVWRILPDSNNSHPAPFPLTLAERCIISTNARVILDPFAGSGTTAVAAMKNGRHYIGCDISPEYVEMARNRLVMPQTRRMFA